MLNYFAYMKILNYLCARLSAVLQVLLLLNTECKASALFTNKSFNHEADKLSYLVRTNPRKN